MLDAGKIHAYDEPYTLLQDPEGIFYKMVQQTGKQEAAALLEAAKQVSFTLQNTFLIHILKWEKLFFLSDFANDVFSGLRQQKPSQLFKRTRRNGGR